MDGPHSWASRRDIVLTALLKATQQPAAELKNGAALIATERKRQIEQEDWTPEHDDEHDRGELARAAICYSKAMDADEGPSEGWPWELGWWKPTNDRVRNLVKAGALICAEIDRLLRLRGSDPGSGREIWQALEGDTTAPDAVAQAGTPETDVIVGAMVQPVQWPIVDKLESLERERNEARSKLAAAQARIAELELSLAAIGEMAIADWNDEVVGKVDAVVKEPLRYLDRLKALFDLHDEVKRLRADNATLHATAKYIEHVRDAAISELAAVKQERDELLPENDLSNAEKIRLAEDTIQKWTERCQLAEHERDELRADVARVRKLASEDSTEERRKCIEAEKARDAARQREINLRSKLIDLLHVHGTGETDEKDGENITQLVERLVAERDEFRSSYEIQHKNYVALAEAIMGGGTSTCSDPFEAAKHLHAQCDALAARLKEASDEIQRLSDIVDKLLNHCPNGECMECGMIVCPHGEPLHLHHDGCPACAQSDQEHPTTRILHSIRITP